LATLSIPCRLGLGRKKRDAAIETFPVARGPKVLEPVHNDEVVAGVDGMKKLDDLLETDATK
jgi:hypothetical protein